MPAITDRTATEPPSHEAADLPRAQHAPLVGMSPGMRQRGPRLLTLVPFLVVWQLITSLGLVKPLHLPSPSAVWTAFVRSNTVHPIAEGVVRFVRDEQNNFVGEHLLASLQRIGVGVGTAIVVGVPVGVLMSTVRGVGVVVEPYCTFCARSRRWQVVRPPTTFGENHEDPSRPATRHRLHGARPHRLRGIRP